MFYQIEKLALHFDLNEYLYNHTIVKGRLKRFVYLTFSIQSITPHQISTPIITVPIHHLYMTWHEYVNVLTTLTRALLRILSKQRA